MTETDAPDFHDEDAASKVSFFAFVFLTVAGYIGLDLLTPQCFDDLWPALFLMIQLVSQLTLICVWGTLVEGTFWFRLPWTILLLVVSWAALCAGVYLADGRISSADIMGLGLVWFYGFAISYVPLKIAAWAFGWRIRMLNEDPASNKPTGYAIRDIMLGTAILAVTLAIGRQLIPGEFPKWSDVLRRSGLDNSETVIALFIFSVISLVVKLPCIWVALAAPNGKVLQQSVVWVGCAGALGLIELGLLIVVLGEPKLDTDTAEFATSLVFGHAFMAATMIGVLYGLRYFGYRMSRTRSKASSDHTGTDLR